MKPKKHIIVTGGAGFIGSHIADRLLKEGHKVTILDNLFTGSVENVPKGADFINLNLGKLDDYSKIENISCNAVFHLAGQSSGEASFKDPLNDLNSHVMSTFGLLDWCRKKEVSRFLYASSMSVYGNPKYLPVDEEHSINPLTFYGAGKVSAEAYIRLYQSLGINTTIFRLFSVYGQGQNLNNKMQGMASIYLSYMLEGSPVTVKGSGERFRDFVYVDDVADAWLQSFENHSSFGKIYNVASGRKTQVRDLLAILKKEFGKNDYPVEYEGNTTGDQFGVVGDIRRIANDISWKPKTDLETGLHEMVKAEKGKLKKCLT